ncbi:MAG: hypothetical protein MJY87_00165 [Fibrobacter sp.]|nr:hypothetical protein [Fibrobacter sp.]
MARVSFKYNVFKSQGYRNRERNCSAPIRFMECSDGTPFSGTFEEYMNVVEANPSLFCFPPLVFETTGFFFSGNLEKTCRALATQKFHGLNEFLEGSPVTLKKNVFSIQSYASLFPDKASAQRCIARMFKPESPYFYFEPLFDGVFRQNVRILEDSVKVISFSREERPGNDVVHFQVRFDMEMKLAEQVEKFDESSLKAPVCWEDANFYSLARCLNEHLDQFYFVDHLKAVMFKNETEEESDWTFCLEFRHLVEKFSMLDYVKLLLSLHMSAEWRDKLEFWVNPEKFDFCRTNSFFSQNGMEFYSYEVPNRTCSNVLTFLVGWRLDEMLMKNLKKFYELIEKKTVEMVYARMPYSIQLETSSFNARIRDVRTIQAMESHCLYVYNAVKNLHDYFQQEILDKGETFFDHISRLVLEQVKLDPADFAESKNPIVQKLSAVYMNGGFFGE